MTYYCSWKDGEYTPRKKTEEQIILFEHGKTKDEVLIECFPGSILKTVINNMGSTHAISCTINNESLYSPYPTLRVLDHFICQPKKVCTFSLLVPRLESHFKQVELLAKLECIPPNHYMRFSTPSPKCHSFIFFSLEPSAER